MHEIIPFHSMSQKTNAVFCNCILFSYVFTAGLQNDHKSIMKLIEEKIHQLHEEARNKQSTQMNTGELFLLRF